MPAPAVAPPRRRTFPRDPWPSPFGWLPAADTPDAQLRLAILERTRLDLGILEVPHASNRGPEIDRYLRRAHVPEALIAAGKGWWCAAWAGCMWLDAGASVPADFGSCDAWLPFLEPCSARELATRAAPGDVVLYGLHKAGRLDAHHIGIVWRTAPLVLSVEGNRGFAGTTNNGIAVDLGPITRTDMLGIVRPLAA